jgi:hypothetical protein
MTAYRCAEDRSCVNVRLYALQRNPKQSISVAQSWPLSLAGEDRQLMTQCGVFQGNLLVTTEHENEESKRAICINVNEQYVDYLCAHFPLEERFR